MTGVHQLEQNWQVYSGEGADAVIQSAVYRREASARLTDGNVTVDLVHSIEAHSQ
jgi:hypothetical protein